MGKTRNVRTHHYSIHTGRVLYRNTRNIREYVYVCSLPGYNQPDVFMYKCCVFGGWGDETGERPAATQTDAAAVIFPGIDWRYCTRLAHCVLFLFCFGAPFRSRQNREGEFIHDDPAGGGRGMRRCHGEGVSISHFLLSRLSLLPGFIRDNHPASYSYTAVQYTPKCGDVYAIVYIYTSMLRFSYYLRECYLSFFSLQL